MNSIINECIQSARVQRRERSPQFEATPTDIHTTRSYNNSYKLGRYVGRWGTYPNPYFTIVQVSNEGEKHIYTFNSPHQNYTEIDLFKRCQTLIAYMSSGMPPVFTPEEYQYGHYEPHHVLTPRQRKRKEGLLINGVYRHRSGRLYVALDIANYGCKDEQKWPLSVIYSSLDNSAKYVRPLKEFLDPEKYEFVK